MAGRWTRATKRGCDHPNARFKDEKELEEFEQFIREHPEWTMDQLGQAFNCSRLCAWRIKNGFRYRPRH